MTHNLNGQFITIAGVSYLLTRVKTEEISFAEKISIVQQECLKMYEGVTVDALFIRNGKLMEVACKHSIYYILNVIYSISCVQVARHYRVDHTTVLNGCNRMKSYIELDDPVGIKVQVIKTNVANRMLEYKLGLQNA